MSEHGPPRISVIVPAYQAATVLPLSLSALLRSDLSRPLWELVVVDDGSSDDSARMLTEAAEALLSIDFGKYINPKLPTPLLNLRDWIAIDDEFCLNKTFFLQVYDPDESFRFNYCEYVMARRLEPAEPDQVPKPCT